MSVFYTVGVCGCDNSGDISDPQDKTEQVWGEVYTQAAAYQRAVELGYDGSLQEFIDSISGRDGVNGTNGNDGVGIKDVGINSDGELIVTLTDDSKITVGRIPACNHKYLSWSSGKAATCTSIGYNVRECSLCGDFDYEFTAAVGHSWDTGVIVKAADCSNVGLRIYGCKSCDTAKREVINPLGEEGHVYKDGFCTVCGISDEPYFRVSFVHGIEGMPEIASKNVVRGKNVTFPADPVREGYTFIGWALEEDASFDKVITENYKPKKSITLYAVWAVGNLFKVNFAYNYEGAPVDIYETSRVYGNEFVKAPQVSPAREGFAFAGWYTAAEGGSLVDFGENVLVTDDTVYYAHWKAHAVVTDIFDAEFVEIDPNKIYYGYSNAVMGKEIITKDYDGKLGATTQHMTGSAYTGGYFVDYQYNKGATLKFIINSTVATEAKLTLRLAMLIFKDDVIFTPDGECAYKVKVNGVSVNYGAITFTVDEIESNNMTGFKDFVIGNISLKQGENIIELLVDNNVYMGGLASATAPVVDCIKITEHGAAVLSWSPEYDNLSKET